MEPDMNWEIMGPKLSHESTVHEAAIQINLWRVSSLDGPQDTA